MKLSLAVKVQHINKECGKDRDSRESKVLKGKEGSQRGNPVKQKRKESSLLCLSFTHLLLFSFITPSYQFIQMTINRIPFSISTAINVLSPIGTHKSKDHEMSISFWTSKSEIKYLYITMTGILVNQLNE